MSPITTSTPRRSSKSATPKRPSFSAISIKTITLLLTVTRGISKNRITAAAFHLNPPLFSLRTPSLLRMSSLTPPAADRDESSFILAGKLPPDHPDYAKLTRQSKSSLVSSPLLDPPIPVPDPYGWLRDESRTDPKVLDHLHAENLHTEASTNHLGGLRSSLYEEMLSAVQETDYTVPTPDGPYVYYTRSVEGKSYTTYCRAPRTDELISWDGDAASPILEGEETYLDVNSLAETEAYCSMGNVATSPDHGLVAYAADFVGAETCKLFVKDLSSGEIVDHDPALECDGSITWGADRSVLYYVKRDDTKRPYRVYRRVLGGKGEDELMYEDDDALYNVGVSKTFDKKYLLISSRSKETSEVHFLDLTDPSSTLQCIASRREKVLYTIRHRNGRWIIATNVGGTPNKKLMESPVGPECADMWTDMLVDDGSGTGVPMFEGGYERTLYGVTPFQDYMVASGREGGIPRVWVSTFGKNPDDNHKVKDFTMLQFDETAYDVGISSNYEYDADKVILSYDSLITPLQKIQVDMSDLENRLVLKEKNVPGYDKDMYQCERITVPSRDGQTPIPVSLVYRKDVMEDLKAGKVTSLPTHLYGYGSYGSSIEDSFRSTRLPLLDRGMVYVIAHVRGGGEMGRQWYEMPNGAKYLCKKNTFHDFVDVAKWLIDDRKLTVSDKLSCEGRSAGGLLIGASINQEPELFKMALLGVPFVDVVCTMIDSSIPLTVVEWIEWGNPNEIKYHQYMMEYSPINNVKQGAKYPACLLTGGLHDPRVQYWEPAKFAAELRHTQSSDSGPTLLKIDMAAGHFSASDRYKYLKELAFDYAFLLDQLGLSEGDTE